MTTYHEISILSLFIIYELIFGEPARVFRLRLRNMLPTNLRGDHFLIKTAILVDPWIRCPCLLVTFPTLAFLNPPLQWWVVSGVPHFPIVEVDVVARLESTISKCHRRTFYLGHWWRVGFRLAQGVTHGVSIIMGIPSNRWFRRENPI